MLNQDDKCIKRKSGFSMNSCEEKLALQIFFTAVSKKKKLNENTMLTGITEVNMTMEAAN